MHGRGAIVATFALHALATMPVGARMPAIRDQAGLDAPSLGLALGAYAVSLLVGTRVVGRLMARFGDRRVLRVGAPLLCLALIPVGFAHDLLTLAAPLVLLGLLAGGLDVTMNAYAVGLERRMGRPILSGLHGAWSAGMLASGAIALAAVAAGIGPAAQFTVSGVACALASVVLLRGLEDIPMEQAGPASAAPVDVRVVLLPTLVLGIIGFGSFVLEGAIMDWGQIYLRDVGHAAAEMAALAYLANAMGMLVSRLLGDRTVVAVGPVGLVRWSCVAAALSLGLVVARPDPMLAVVAYAVIGLAVGPIFPVALSAAGAMGSASSFVLGWVVTMAYLGSVAGPMLIGFVAGAAGLREAFLIPVVLGIVLAFLAPAVRGAARGPRPSSVPDTDAPLV
ncbi:MAG: MFS transporter [Candidatus Limnocylindrales bacterium]